MSTASSSEVSVGNAFNSSSMAWSFICWCAVMVLLWFSNTSPSMV
ncbi:hypothetical protein [Pseudomonas sp. S2_A02]